MQNRFHTAVKMKNPSLILAVLATIYNTADAAVSQSQWYSTMKAPNERFVLNAEQAATAIQAAAAIAANNRYCQAYRLSMSVRAKDY